MQYDIIVSHLTTCCSFIKTMLIFSALSSKLRKRYDLSHTAHCMIASCPQVGSCLDMVDSIYSKLGVSHFRVLSFLDLCLYMALCDFLFLFPFLLLLISLILSTSGLEYSVALSTRPEHYLGSLELWYPYFLISPNLSCFCLCVCLMFVFQNCQKNVTFLSAGNKQKMHLRTILCPEILITQYTKAV